MVVFFAGDESSEYTGDEDVFKPQDDESDSEEEEEEEGRSEDVDEQELKELGACGNSAPELVLDSFKDWLQRIDGGDRELRTAKQYVSRLWEKLMEDLDKLIKSEDVQKFASSEMVTRAVAVLGQHMEKDGPKTPSQMDYCLVRDHLITRLVIENACRASPTGRES